MAKSRIPRPVSPAVKTEVRNSPIPKVAPAAKSGAAKQITHEAIARRA